MVLCGRINLVLKSVAGKLAQELRAHPDRSSIPNTHGRRLPTARNSSSRGPDASSLLRHNTLMHRNKQSNRKVKNHEISNTRSGGYTCNSSTQNANITVSYIVSSRPAQATQDRIFKVRCHAIKNSVFWFFLESFKDRTGPVLSVDP